MQSEALGQIRTMRQVSTSLDLARKQRIRTTNSLSKTEAEVVYLRSLTDRQLEQILAKERKRFATQEMAMEKSRRRVLKSREKLAVTINRNHALNELRYEMQRARWEGREPPMPPKKEVPFKGEKLRPMGLRY